MAITFSANAADKRMVQWWSGDTLTGWGGPNDGLDSFGAQIEGSSCVVIAARKNETLSITYTSTLTNVPTGSQLIFNTYTIIGNVLNSLSITVNDGSTGTATYNILSEFTGTTPSLNLGSFVAVAMDLGAGTLNPSVNNLSDISYDLSVQNVNIRATDNFFLDAAYVGDGVTLIGTTVGDKLFTEAQAQDISSDIHNGVLQAFEDVIFAQHDIDIDTTTGNSDKESLTFIETNNGANTYELNGTGTAVFTGTNVQTTGTVTCTVNMSNMTSFSMTAGSMNNITTITFGSTSAINRANFNDITTFSTGTSTFTNNTLNTVTTANISTAATGCSFNSIATPNVTGAVTTSLFNECGEVDISTGGGTLTSCTFTNTTAAIALTVADLNDIDSLTFTGDNTSHAVNLGTISTSISRSWNHTIVSGYAATSQASNASSTPGDSEVILVNVASGITLTLSIGPGITAPTYRNTGPGTVQILQQFDLTVSGLLGNTELRVFENPSLFTGGVSSVEAAGVETVAAVTQTNTGSNYIFYSEDLTPNVTAIQRQGAGVDFTTIGLVNGDKIRVVVRDNVDNPTLQLFDEFEVDGTVTSSLIPVVDVPTSSTKFSSVIGSTTNSKTVTIEKVNASETFQLDAGTYDVFTYRVGSLPIVTKGLVVNANTSLPLSQTVDRVYNNPA